MRRAGRVLTGVDRVEMAYLKAFLADDVPAFGLVRTPFGYVLLDDMGLRAMCGRLSHPSKMASPDVLSLLSRGLTRTERKAQTEVRRNAFARALPPKLDQMLAKHLPQGTHYFNVGHSNLTDRVLQAVRGLGGVTAVMVHDVIPLDFPQYQRVGTVEVFREKLMRVRQFADVVIYNSADTQTRTEAQMAVWGDVPRSIVSHLGTEQPYPNPDFICPKTPYFVTIGTIEPRKNHAFLLDLWEELGPAAPELHIVGSRGWNNDAVFSRLDALDEHGPVRERNGLCDADMLALLQGASGFLFPSFAEGFGLPPVEAAMLGVPILSNELGVIREILDDIPVYASVSDRYLWLTTIKQMAGDDPKRRKFDRFSPPDWTAHFNTVLSLI
ncbi:glycosyltransferase [Ascidiaceihabitans sp.]|uniref:glycosyltransferase n=1 Tax=Ascidiaceihabitans sp. TaxID=1872644 RepID=UPI00329A0578